MHCVFPACVHATGHTFSESEGITFHRFPEEVYLRRAWLEALGKASWELQEDSVICSKHFLPEDFLVTRNGRMLRTDAVPVTNVQVCRICFTRDHKLCIMKDERQPDLSRPSYALAYENLTGLTIEPDDKLPPYLCIQCANQLLKCVRFRAGCLRAHAILVEIVNDYGSITLESILSATGNQNLLCSNIPSHQSDSEHTDSENTLTDEQDVKQEELTVDSVKPESDAFDHNIMITDVRSTNDGSPNPQECPVAAAVKTEGAEMVNRGVDVDVVIDNDPVRPPRPPDDLVDDHVKDENNDVTQLDNANELLDNGDTNEPDNTDNEHHDNGQDGVVNGRLPSVTATQRDKISRTRVKQETTAPNHLKQKLNRKRKSEGEDVSLEESLAPGEPGEISELSDIGVTEVMKLPNDLNQPLVNGYWKSSGNGERTIGDEISCDMCAYQPVGDVQLMKHLKARTGTNVNVYEQCYFNRNYKTSRKLKHNAKHFEEKPYSYDVCNKLFSKDDKLKINSPLLSDTKPFSCDICNKIFKSKAKLEIHYRTHSDEKPYICIICNMPFRHNNELQNHTRTHSGEQPFSCAMCNKAFIQRGQLQHHLRTHSGEKPYSCDICDKAFCFRGRLQNHMRVHDDKVYSCALCDKSYKNQYLLQNHLQVHSDEIKKYWGTTILPKYES